jgi:rod shape-determining protein MreD
MRRVILTIVTLGIVLVLQLSVVNGLRLPGGGVPDFLLVAVAAIGMTGGPMTGAVTGFAAGLCLDLAPPGSGIVGEYALVFCLAGWACGRFRGILSRSALLPMAVTAAVAVVAELLVAGLTMALTPASWSAVREVLPATAFYDAAISPFVLYLILLGGAWLAGDAISASEDANTARLRRARRSGAASPLAGGSLTGRQGLAGLVTPVSPAGGAVLLGLGGWLAGPPRSRRERKAAARRTPRLGGGRPGDGWVGGSAAARSAFSSRRAAGGSVIGSVVTGGLAAGRPHGSGAARLRSGVAGSAAGGQAARPLAARPVRLRLGAGRRRDGVLGAVLPGSRSALAGRGAGGSALSRTGLSRTGLSRTGLTRTGLSRTSFSGTAGSALGQHGPSASGPAQSGMAVRESGLALRGGGLSGSGPARLRSAGSGSRRRGLPGLWLLRFPGRRRDGVVGGGALTRVGGTAIRSSAPRFRISGSGGLVAGGGANSGVRPSAPRLRMRSRHRDGVLGSPLSGGRTRGSAQRPASPRFRARPLGGSRTQSGKRPRFGRRRGWPVLSLLTGRRGGLPLRRRLTGKRKGGSA